MNRKYCTHRSERDEIHRGPLTQRYQSRTQQTTKSHGTLHLTRHSHTAIKSQHHAIQHDILNALRNKLCKLMRLTRSHYTTSAANIPSRRHAGKQKTGTLTRKFHNPRQTRPDFITHHSRHPRIKQTRRHRNNPNAMSRQVPCQRQRKRGNSSFGSGVGDLAGLPVEGC